MPLPALLDMRCLSLLNIISQLGPSHILHRIGRSILSDTKPCRFLWFSKIRETCSKYSLPDPLSILNNPPRKQVLKKLIKSKVMEFWEANLRLTSSSLPSLEFFKCQFYSLSKPHPIWTSAGSNPYEVERAICQARMLSGRYRTCWFSRHWSGDKTGSCSLPTCKQSPVPGTLSHILVDCLDLQPARSRVFRMWSDYLKNNPILIPIISKYTIGDAKDQIVQFLLDCSVLSDVISLRQRFGMVVYDSLFHLTRSYCFSLHKSRLKLLGKWNTR